MSLILAFINPSFPSWAFKPFGLKYFLRYLWLLILALCQDKFVIAQNIDTLKPVVVHNTSSESASPVAVQRLSEKELQTLNSVSVADAIKFFSGVMVKDYGGIGGLKTISVRSLGAQHTGVLYDGIIMADARAGQIDLGRISMDNVKDISLYQSAPSPWLQPARAFSQVAVLAINSYATKKDEPDEVLIKLSGASFGSISPTLFMRSKLNNRVSWLLNGFYQQADGNYSFKGYEHNDTLQYRSNADIKQWKIESDLPVMLRDSSTLLIKTFYYQSNRGLPGSVIFYNPKSSQRLNNRHGFAQLIWRKNLLSNIQLQLAAKSSIDRQVYIDNDFSNSAGYLKNDFAQQEHYFSFAGGWKINETLSSGIATDLFFNILSRKDTFITGFVSPRRNTIMSNAFINWKKHRIEFLGNLLYTHISQTVAFGNAGRDISRPSPALSFSFQPLSYLPLRVRAFYKEIFRAPSLDDQFYTYVGNANLKPELANQFDIGLTYERNNVGPAVSMLSITVDGYLMHVKDKIVALPRNNLFQWSMANIGKVQTLGVDVALFADLRLNKKVQLNLSINYGFQDAKDKTDRMSYAYNKQIPFIPEHNGSGRIAAVIKNFSCAYNMLLSGYRYRQGAQNTDNYIAGYVLSDIHTSYSWSSKGRWKVKSQFEWNNIFNKSYEVVKFFPMPGSNWRIGLILENKKAKK